jgi:hypothetical protein
MGKFECAAFVAMFFVAINSAEAKDALPANVTASGKNVTKIDWSFDAGKEIPFPELKRCIATNLVNDDLTLSDSSRSFVGSYTGNYYRSGDKTTVQGKDIFKYVDDGSKTAVAQGWIKKAVFAFSWILRFDLEAATEGTHVKLVMRNLNVAMSDTGSASNNGFTPLLTSYRFKQNYETLQTQANAIQACLRGE